MLKFIYILAKTDSGKEREMKENSQFPSKTMIQVQKNPRKSDKIFM